MLEIFANLTVYCILLIYYFGQNLPASSFIPPSPSIWNSRVYINELDYVIFNNIYASSSMRHCGLGGGEMDIFFRKNHILRCFVWLSLLNWIRALTLSLLLKLPPRKLEPWFFLWSFFLLRLLYLYKSTIWPCMEYSCYVWTVAPSCYLESLDKLQKRMCRTVVPSLAVSLEPMAHCRNVASLSFFIVVTLVDVRLNWLN